MATVESAKDRRVLVRDAGFGSTSFVSCLAGVLVAFGAVALALAVTGAVGSQLGLRTDGISTREWRNAGVAGAVFATIVVFLSFYFGGYTAGRMARRGGPRHGLVVFLFGALVVAVVTGLAAWLGDTDEVRDRLTANGVPLDRNTWSDIGVGAAIAGVAAMFLGSVIGGIRGERWHGRLVSAAAEHRDTEQQEIEDRESAVDIEESQRPDESDHDETTVDLRDEPTEPSVEAEREQARIGRSDVGL